MPLSARTLIRTGFTLAVAVIFGWLSGWTGGPEHAGIQALGALLGGGGLALLWLASAFGLGEVIPAPGGRARGGAPRDPALDAALGVAALLVLDAVVGRVGGLAAGGGEGAWGAWGAWATLVPGWLLLLWRLRRRPAAGPRTPLHPLLIAAAPAVAVLLLAAASAPGYLWGTEFGGYDALSYHLQLPREWLALGRVRGLEHNVYSYLPSYVEAAYLHLFALRHGAVDAVLACQFLHAGMALLTAVLVARIAQRMAGPAAAALAGVLVLGTPWVCVTGSLAYNEMAVTLLLAGAVMVVLEPSPGGAAAAPGTAIRAAIAVGLLMGAACGAKPTATGLVALPVCAVMMLRSGSVARAVAVAGLTMAVAAAALAPALIADGLESGNPVFPFLTALFGRGHWTAAQAAIWTAAHGSDLGLAARLREGLGQLLHDGSAAATGPLHLPQWSVLPWLAIVAVLAGAARRPRRRLALELGLILTLQLAFWLFLTHIKARFVVPAVVPAALLVAVVAGEASTRAVSGPARWAATAIAAVLATLFATLPLVIFAGEQHGRPAAAIGALDLFTGAADAARLAGPGLSAARRRALEAEAVPAWWINAGLGPAARVLCVGEATPLYYDGRRIAYHTVWDRGPLSRLMREAGNDPRAWIEGLRAEGFTHLLVNTTMLGLWTEAGWNDPLLTSSRVTGAADAWARRLQSWRYGLVLYELPEPVSGRSP